MTCKPEDNFRIQECWKVMLKSNEMLKIEHNAMNSKKFKVEKLEQVHLSEDFDCISYIDGKDTRKMHNSDMESILSGNKLPGWIADNCPGIEDFSIDRCFTITTLSDENSYLNLVAPTAAIASCWIRGLETLVKSRPKAKEAENARDEWLRGVFNQLNKIETKQIKYAELFNYVNSRRDFEITEDDFHDEVKEFLRMNKRKEKSKKSTFNEEEFIQVYKFMCRRKEIEFVFRSESSNGAIFTLSDIQSFLTQEQNLPNVTQQYCSDLINSFEVTQSGRDRLELGIDGFMAYMSSEKTELFNSAHEKVYQDMTQPLPHYYIASSHNTYLTGNQLKGYSSVQAYRDVLEKGGRCVELDCWDGGEAEPIVYHGHTLTSKIPFREIIHGIKESAFKTSPYPVIVSLENHCSEEGQRKMAQYLVEILGDALYNEPVDLNLKCFPSPEFFKNKIIVRGKKLKEECSDDEEQEMERTHSGNGNEKPGEKQEKQDSHLRKQNVKPDKQVMANETNKGKADQNDRRSSINGNSSEDEHLAVSKRTENRLSPQSSPASRRRKHSFGKAKKTVAKELSELINYVANTKFRSFIDYFTNGQFTPQSSSFVESEMQRHIKESASEFVEYNKRLLSRIYPGNLRIESGNYDPVKPWSVGCQVVALNHQTNSEQMHLHYGKFRQNGRAGYVLKPWFLRDPRVKFDPSPLDGKFPGIQSKHLRLTVISGQQFPTPVDTWSLVKDEPDPYVQIEICGVPADEVTLTTKGLTDNSFNPIWNEVFERTVLVPELALIRFVVYDEDYGFDDFIGQVVVPFESMQQGYRHIQLLDMDSEPIPSASLFVHVSISDIAMTS